MGGGNAARRRWSAVWASCRRWAGTAWRRLGARAAAPRAPLHACRAPDPLASGRHARGRLCCCVLAGRLAMAPALRSRRALVPCERMRPARHASRSPRAQQAHRLTAPAPALAGPRRTSAARRGPGGAQGPRRAAAALGRARAGRARARAAGGRGAALLPAVPRVLGPPVGRGAPGPAHARRALQRLPAAVRLGCGRQNI